MDIKYARFNASGDTGRYLFTLAIGLLEVPPAFSQTGADFAYYLDQVGCFLFAPGDVMEGESGYTLSVELHRIINPNYDLAVRQLLGDDLAKIVQDRFSFDEHDALSRSRGDEPWVATYEKLLNEQIDTVKALQIINRIQANATFL